MTPADDGRDLGWAAPAPPPPRRVGSARTVWLVSLPLRAVVAVVFDAGFLILAIFGWVSAFGAIAMDVIIRRSTFRQAGHKLFVQWPVATVGHLREYAARCLDVR